MKKGSRKRAGRAPLVRQDDPAKVDEDGYERTTAVADVLFTVVAEGTVDPDRGASWKLRASGRAPADSALGRSLATMPLCAILGVPPFVMGLAGHLFVRLPWITAGMTILGLAGGVWFAWQLTRQRPQSPAGQQPEQHRRAERPGDHPDRELRRGQDEPAADVGRENHR